MLKKVKSNMEKYIYHTIVPSYNDSSWHDECYTFGYLDGYFDEDVYIEYIVDTMNNDEKIMVYKAGFEKGSFDKKRDNIYESKSLKNEKIEWLKKLALHDSLNNVESRNLKEDSLNIYNHYREGTFSLKKMDFINDSSIKKAKR